MDTRNIFAAADVLVVSTFGANATTISYMASAIVEAGP